MEEQDNNKDVVQEDQGKDVAAEPVQDSSDVLPIMEDTSDDPPNDPLAVFRQEGLIDERVRDPREAAAQLRERMGLAALSELIDALPPERAVPFVAALGAEGYEQFRALLVNDPAEVVRTYYQARGLGQAEVDALVTTLTSEGKLEEAANKAVAEVQRNFDKKVRELAEQRRAQQSVSSEPSSVMASLFSDPSGHLKNLPYKDGVKTAISGIKRETVISRVLDAIQDPKGAAHITAIMAYYNPKTKEIEYGKLMKALDLAGPGPVRKAPPKGQSVQRDAGGSGPSPEEILKALIK
ncbi:MAG: hypothetical protein D6790_15090 [Caldilineae bacterium]|nr:MAG: hypothetical protein D6790_15090 [Caldilineae bacterium]